MSDNLKTIKELADELGVSKTAINKKVTERERKLWFAKIGNKFVINEIGQSSIKTRFEEKNENLESKTENQEQKPKSKTENSQNNENNSDIKYILEIIESQKEQIKDLQNTKDEQFKQLRNMQNLLDQQQRLALQDKKLLEEYKVENDSLKALKIPSQETKEELVDNQSQEVTNVVEETTEVPRKWWQFWR